MFTSTFSANSNGTSRLIKLNMSDNLLSFLTFLPDILFSNDIVELHLLRYDRQASINLPTLFHLILTYSPDSLNSCSLLASTIRSIRIILHHQSLRFSSDDWSVFRILSTLPLLISLHVLLYDMGIPPDDVSCQVIAETASTVSDFPFCF